MSSTTEVPDTAPVPPGAVVAGYDGRPVADRALDWAAREALASGRPLAVVHALTSTPVLQRPGLAGVASLTAPAPGDTLQRTPLQRAAEELATRFPELSVSHLEIRGDPVVELAALGSDAGLLVVGSRGDGAVRNIPSAQVGTRLARLASIPVVVVPHYQVGLVRRGVLAGVSVRKHAPEVLDHAFAYADAHDLPLTIVHASRDTLRAPHEDRVRWLAETVSGYATDHPGVRAETRVETGRPARILLRLAENMDLLVVGQHSAGETNPLGHVRASIADRSPCPVMVVPPRPDGHSRP